MDESSRKEFKTIVELFKTEVTTQTSVLKAILDTRNIDSIDSKDLEALLQVFRSITGGAKIMQLLPLVELSHNIELFLLEVIQGRLNITGQHIKWFHDVYLLLLELKNVSENQFEAYLRSSNLSDLISNFLVAISPDTQTATGHREYPAKTIQPLQKENNELDPALINLFKVELENQRILLDKGLLELEEHPHNKSILEGLMRAAHSLKGAARIVQLDLVVQLTHNMEEFFVDLQNNTMIASPTVIDILLQALNILNRLYQIDGTKWSFWLLEEQSAISALIKKMVGMLPKTENVESNAPSQDISAAFTKQQKGIKPVEEKVIPLPSSEILSQSQIKKMVEASKDDKAKGFVKKEIQKNLHDEDRVLRVTTQNLNHLMGLAGESLVESRWLQPFAKELGNLKNSFENLSKIALLLKEKLEKYKISEKTTNYLITVLEKINECLQNISQRYLDLDLFIRRHVSLSDRLYEEVIDSRMRPFSDGTEGLPRIVRDISRQRGKKIKLEIYGKATRVDREILEKLESPLIHLIKNAIDYGIETPEEREIVGKPAESIIHIEARHIAGMLSIQIKDDGRGINVERLRNTIVQRNLLDVETAAQLKDYELFEYLLLPGFSLNSVDDAASGPGIGLHVVSNMLQQVGGSIQIFSEAAVGTTISLQLPLTLSVIRSLLVKVSGQPYAFPLGRIELAVVVPKTALSVIENRLYLNLEGENIGLVFAQQILDVPFFDKTQKLLPIIVMKDKGNAYGIIVEEFLGERDLVVQELDPRLGKVHNISTGAFLEDGSPILIVDIEDIIKSLDILIFAGKVAKLEQMQQTSPIATLIESPKRILVIDDSLTVREVESRLLRNHGYIVDAAIDGLEGWKALHGNTYDLILTDIDMPRMNGIELIRMIKKDPNLRSIPVIILSYKESDTDRIGGLEAGADYYLTKSSFHDKSLINAVHELLGKAEKIPIGTTR